MDLISGSQIIIYKLHCFIVLSYILYLYLYIQLFSNLLMVLVFTGCWLLLDIKIQICNSENACSNVELSRKISGISCLQMRLIILKMICDDSNRETKRCVCTNVFKLYTWPICIGKMYSIQVWIRNQFVIKCLYCICKIPYIFVCNNYQTQWYNCNYS